MRKVIVSVAAFGVLVCFGVVANGGVWLEADIEANVFAEQPSANVGDWLQVGQVAGNPNSNANNYPFGTFTSYSASSGLPQVGSDLDKFGFALSGQIDSISGQTFGYSGNWWILAPGYGFDDTGTEYLEKGTFDFTGVYTSDWAQADISGYMYPEVGDRQPTNDSGTEWPDPVDWSSAGRAYFEGISLSKQGEDGSDLLTGTMVVPEPATWLIWCLLGATAWIAARRRRG